MIKIKKKYLGSKINKGVQTYTLSDNLSQAELSLLKNVLSSIYFEEYIDKPKKDKKNETNINDEFNSTEEFSE